MANVVELPTLLGLPAELILHVLSYLEALEIVSISQTCRLLLPHSRDDQIWQPIVNADLPYPIADPRPCKTFHELYVAHHPNWFLPRHRIWFSDAEPGGKLLLSEYDQSRGSIDAYAVVAARGHHTLEFWEKDREVIIHSFNPKIALDLERPVLRLDVDSPRTEDQPNNNPSDRGYAPASRLSKEVLMETSSEAGLYSSFMLCRTLPKAAISGQTKVWPPLRFPAATRTRNDTRDGYNSNGHRPSTLGEVSTHNFRLRKWVEYTGRRSSPRVLPFTSPNGLSAALGIVGPYFAQSLRSSLGDGMSIRMPEDINTYATLPEACYKPTAEKPWQGIWCGDYSGHGCEFLVITQPDKKDERALPSGTDWLREWFKGGRRGSSSSHSSYASAQEEADMPEAQRQGSEEDPKASSSAEGAMVRDLASEVMDGFMEAPNQRTLHAVTDYKDAPTGRLEAIKLTGDPNVPRGEYTFIAPDIGHGGFMRVADETIFRGARIVRSAGHIAGRGFVDGTLSFLFSLQYSEPSIDFWQISTRLRS